MFHFLGEIEVVCEEIKRSHDMPSRRASKELFSASFRAHPYGRPVIGFEADVRSHTRERVLNFYAKHYTPSNIVLSAVGDVTEAQVREWTPRRTAEVTGIAEKTIKVHRARFMHKLGVRTIADLVRLVLGRQPATEAHPLVGEQREREHPQHQPLLGLGGMQREGQRVVGVDAAVDVGDRQLELVDGGAQGHGARS